MTENKSSKKSSSTIKLKSIFNLKIYSLVLLASFLILFIGEFYYTLTSEPIIINPFRVGFYIFAFMLLVQVFRKGHIFKERKCLNCQTEMSREDFSKYRNNFRSTHGDPCPYCKAQLIWSNRSRKLMILSISILLPLTVIGLYYQLFSDSVLPIYQSLIFVILWTISSIFFFTSPWEYKINLPNDNVHRPVEE